MKHGHIPQGSLSATGLRGGPCVFKEELGIPGAGRSSLNFF